MKVDGVPYRTIWLGQDGWSVEIIDQTRLPYHFETVRLASVDDAAHAISAMLVRGAPLIGATAAYGMALAMRAGASDATLQAAHDRLLATRPTAVNLRWALDTMAALLRPLNPDARVAAAYREAARICDEDAGICEAIGNNGLALITALHEKKNDRVNLLTHCNAGWLATVDWGTALAPIYKAHDAGIPVHVWVDETRPRNQGAALTAWELGRHGVPHTVIVDNAGGHLMQTGQVDMAITGTDRTSANGDVCNKIGTYLKALAAHDNGVPFYVALPSPTIDWTLPRGSDIPIEERGGDEVSLIAGRGPNGEVVRVQLTPDGSPLGNPAFDVTPARLVTGLVTERGICAASSDVLAGLFPELARAA
ncbi:MAG: S-methyl-5-thioribose-1-phosphate isomerase [Rhodospirillaceae bacterium]|nr:S-methyl-5-thioribose-1-phosphate isomerase [Rhodospirillaceae bacterium]